MASDLTQVHVADLGKVLLSVRKDLNELRKNVKESGSGSASGQLSAQLDQLISRAENDLRQKAELVLQTVASEKVSTLPLSQQAGGQDGTHHPAFGMSARGATRGARSQAGSNWSRTSGMSTSSAGERLREARQLDMMLNTQNSKLNRALLEQKFGVPKPPVMTSDNKPARPSGNPKGQALQRGKQTAPRYILPAANRRDPTAPPPPITDDDVTRNGLLNLITHGYVPPAADLSSALMVGSNGAPLLTSGAAQIHPNEDQYLAPTTLLPPPASNEQVKLDLATQPGNRPPLSPRTGPPRQELATVSLAADGEREGDGESPAPAEEETNIARLTINAASDPRSYDELMDQYSLHQFIIRHGQAITSTPEFVSFQRKHDHIWGPLSVVLGRLESLLANYAIPLGHVDGRLLAQLAANELDTPTDEQLLSCLLNAEKVRLLMTRPGRRFQGTGGIDVAATKIQALWRRSRARGDYSNRQQSIKAAGVIQSIWRVFVARRYAQQKLLEVREMEDKQWAEMMEKFYSNWPHIKRRQRVIVHINSLSYDVQQRRTIPDFMVRQNGQMSRLCDLKDPNVEIIYVAPFPLGEDLVQYYHKLLQVGGIDNPEHRYRIVYPENHDRLPEHMSLTQKVLYSPRCLRRIKNFCKGRQAYIVPGAVGQEEVTLSKRLHVPLFSPEPTIANLYSTKSGAKRIFAAAEVMTAPGARDIYDKEELLNTLATLISENLEVPRWVFKIDDEFGGRGHAYFDVFALKSYTALQHEKQQSPDIWRHPTVQEAVTNQILEDLRECLATSVVIAQPRLYKSWNVYVTAFTRVGGIVEACPQMVSGSPSVNLLIEPDGNVTLTSTHDQFFSTPYCFAGALFPQTSVPFPALRDAAIAIGRQCFAKRIIGNIGLDFVAYQHNDEQRLWVVDLNLHTTDTWASFKLFNFILDGKLDPQDGQYYIDPPPGYEDADRSALARHYVSSDFLYQPSLATVQYNVFFGMCRQKGITFDLQEKTGTVFNIMDNLSQGFLGVSCVGRRFDEALSELSNGMTFIQHQLAATSLGRETGANKTSAKQFKHVLQIVRAMLKQEQENIRELLREEEEAEEQERGASGQQSR